MATFAEVETEVETQECTRCYNKREIESFEGKFKTCKHCRDQQRESYYKNRGKDKPRYGSEEWKRKVGEGRIRGFREQVEKEAVEPFQLEFGYCSRCTRHGRKGRQPAKNFGLRTVTLKSGIDRTYLRNECRVCEVERQKIRLQDPEAKARDKARQKKYRQKNKAHIREYQRIWNDGNRRKRGAKPRRKMAHRQPEETYLPVEPFQQWIREKADWYAKLYPSENNQTPGALSGIGPLSLACHVTERTLRRVMEPATKNVTFSMVDKALTNEGSTMLWELYDHL